MGWRNFGFEFVSILFFDSAKMLACASFSETSLRNSTNVVFIFEAISVYRERQFMLSDRQMSYSNCKVANRFLIGEMYLALLRNVNRSRKATIKIHLSPCNSKFYGHATFNELRSFIELHVKMRLSNSRYFFLISWSTNEKSSRSFQARSSRI